MKKRCIALALTWSLSFAAPAGAQTINALGAGRGSVIGTDLFPSYQGANPAVRPSAAQLAAYVYGLASGDLTANGTGAHTLATVNGNVGSFGSTTQCTSITVNAKGLITAASQGACAPPFSAVTGRATLAQLPQGIANSIWINPTGSTADMQNVAVPACANDGAHGLVYVNGSGLACATLTGVAFANPTGTAGPTANNGSAGTAMRSDATPAIQKASNAQFGIMEGDGTTLTCTAGVCSAAPISAVPSVQSGTNYPIVDGDRAKVIYLSNAAAQTPTLPNATTLTSSNGWFVTVCNIAAGIQTLTPTTSTIGGAASLAIPGGSAARPVCWNAVSDGTNYNLVPAGNNNTIANGTSALGTGAISSATCATVVTTSAPGVVTTDVVLGGFNGDPTAVTGYIPATAGMLTIFGYPTANNVNWKVCNNTTASITPGAITLNWRVMR